MKVLTNTLSENLKRKELLGDSGVDGSIILKGILNRVLGLKCIHLGSEYGQVVGSSEHGNVLTN
jgi:hypothetical protein